MILTIALLAASVSRTDFDTYHKPQQFIKLPKAVALTDFERKPVTEKIVHETIQWCPDKEHLQVTKLTDDGSTLTVTGSCVQDVDQELSTKE